jgi:hypothetical protein
MIPWNPSALFLTSFAHPQPASVEQNDPCVRLALFDERSHS